MVKFRNIRIKMKSGKSRIQRAMVLASGKLRFVKNISRSRSSAPRHTTKTTKTKHYGGYHMGKKKCHRSGSSPVRAVEKIVKLGALFAPAAEAAFAPASNRDKLGVICYRYTGFDPRDSTFHIGRMMQGWGPYVAVEGGTRIAHKIIGLIRRL